VHAEVATLRAVLAVLTRSRFCTGTRTGLDGTDAEDDEDEGTDEEAKDDSIVLVSTASADASAAGALS